MEANYKDYFKGKKITLMGLGLLGRGVGDAKFLAECGADLIVTDLKTEEQLLGSLKKLEKYPNIKYTLGEHKLKDFHNRDLIIKAAGVPLNSLFIAEAEKNKIPVTMSTALFAKLTEATLIGVTGTRGKTTVTNLIYEILKVATEKSDKNKVLLGGNIRGISTLALLKKNLKPEDMVVLELDSWQLQGFHTEKISPHVAVFTNLLIDHQNYYGGSMEKYLADKAGIFLNQQSGDFLIVGSGVANLLKKKYKTQIKGHFVEVDVKNWLVGLKTKLLGEHNKLNVLLALEAVRALGISDSVSRRAIKDFAGVPGRLELVAEKDGLRFFNDTTATTPDGVIAALRSLIPALKKNGRIVLLGGGMDKELDYKNYGQEIKKTPLRALVLFKGTGSDKILAELQAKKNGQKEVPTFVVENMKSAFAMAMSYAEKGDIVLLSPGATSFGIFKNEYDRGDQFIEEVRNYQKQND